MAATTTHRKRLTKHELKEDKFVTLTYKTWDEVLLHRTTLLFLGVGIVLTVAIVALYKHSASSGAARSEEILFLAMSDYEAGKFQEASNGLTQFLDRFPRHARRGVGAVALGNCDLALGKPAEAEPRFKTALDAVPKGSDLWVAAKSGLGRVAEAQGNFPAAATQLEEAARAATSKEAGAEAMAHAIRAKVRAGDVAGALALLDSTEKDYPGTRALRLYNQIRGEIEATEK